MKNLLTEILSQWTEGKKSQQKISAEMERSVKCFIDGFSIQYGYHFLGLLKYFGIGMVEDRKQGFAYISKSAAVNVVDSVAWMAVLYLIDDSEYDIVANKRNAAEHLDKLNKLMKGLKDSDELKFYKSYSLLINDLINDGKKQKKQKGSKKAKSYNETLVRAKKLAKRCNNCQFSLLVKTVKLAKKSMPNDMITFS